MFQDKEKQNFYSYFAFALFSLFVPRDQPRPDLPAVANQGPAFPPRRLREPDPLPYPARVRQQESVEVEVVDAVPGGDVEAKFDLGGGGGGGEG